MNPTVLSRRVYHSGQIVFRESEPGDVMYLVERGSVRIWRGTADDPLEIGVIPQGGVFGEMAIFDGKPRMASASAAEETVLVQINGDKVRAALHKADPIIPKLIQVILDSARNLAQQLEEAKRPPTG
ncbi:cyclic nucleotide-binding domain-containing protein [Azospirillum sp.]|uniref:Crp/Fnr family transcriptional regulator n=1 Tax=Azospirillum sp. TaxID=34012 RepID=UPI002D6E70E6|nr:cyclic nucleotide-binding domain-containing protein [Azospirillum sp.]HYD67694.1 cyclic nucleotide-binding domain-containing protein [Azospirillum sp.]